MTQAQQKQAPLFDALLATMASLKVVMEEEIALLAKQDIEGLKILHEQKSKLVLNHHAGMKEIALNPSVLQGASQEVRSRLKKSGEALAEVSKRNEIALKGAVQGTKLLLQNIIGMVKQEKTTMHSYANPNSFKSWRSTTQSPCSPIACNRTA